MENETIKLNIDIEDVFKLDVRIGVITAAEKIEGTQLIKQQVNFGEGIGSRQIVSKIAKNHTAEDLIGKHATYILNLPTREVRGVESQGMIVAAEDKESKMIILMTPELLATPGSIVF